MHSLFIFVGLIALWIGWKLIFRKDIAWNWTKSHNSLRGQADGERNYDWELASTLQGYLALAAGMGAIGFGLYIWYQEANGIRW